MSDGILQFLGAILGGLIGAAGSLIVRPKGEEGNSLGLSGFGWLLLGLSLGTAVGLLAAILLGNLLGGAEDEPETSGTDFTPAPPLIIDEVEYSLPSADDAFYCIAQQVHTQGNNQRTYSVVIPDGWVMAWDSYGATWREGGYNTDGLVVIFGPWEDNLTINTGGSCSGPVQWANQIVENRCLDYPVSYRPIFVVNNSTFQRSQC